MAVKFPLRLHTMNVIKTFLRASNISCPFSRRKLTSSYGRNATLIDYRYSIKLYSCILWGYLLNRRFCWNRKCSQLLRSNFLFFIHLRTITSIILSFYHNILIIVWHLRLHGKSQIFRTHQLQRRTPMINSPTDLNYHKTQHPHQPLIHKRLACGFLRSSAVIPSLPLPPAPNSSFIYNIFKTDHFYC